MTGVSLKHEVVISGFSGRFPACQNIQEFKDKLFSKESLLTSDTDRWNPAERETPYIAGKMDNVNRFDHTLAGIHSKLVEKIDPLLGNIIEKSIEAMFDAGINPFTLKGRNICVIAAHSISEAEILRIADQVEHDSNTMVGSSRAMLANRLSYLLNFNGPSYTLDSSWVSGIQALEMAATLVAQGAVESAVVSACNLTLLDSIETEYSGLNILSHQGICSPFDSNADGVIRSEATVSFFLQRAQDAKRHYCTVFQAQAHFLGERKSSFIQIDHTLESFLRDFYKNANIHPSRVSYVEAFGCGEKSYDTEELNALGNVFSCQKDSPILVGSVSGNMGNSECASGLVSMAKVIIALESGIIPPTINYHTPNPLVPALADENIKVVTEPTELVGDLVAVNGLGFSGSAGHVLIKKFNKTKKSLSIGELPEDRLPRLVILQARHEKGVKAITEKISTIPVDVEYVSMINDVYRDPVPFYLWRAYTILPAPKNNLVQNVQKYDPVKRPVWYIFSGMGSQWLTMGKELLYFPVFAATVDKCDHVLSPLGVDIKHILTTENQNIFNNITHAFIGITVIQTAGYVFSFLMSYR